MPEPQLTPRLRLFVAVSVPEAVKARLLETQTELRRAVPRAQIRWARPEQFHLTLRFLGGVAADRVPELANSLRAASSRFAPLRLRAGGVGFFPGPRSPRVVWAGVSDEANALAPLHEAVQESTAAYTEEAPESRFTGHITLGRVKGMRPAEAESLAAAAARFSSSLFGEWTAPELHLIRSELSPDGARYSVLEAVSLMSA